MYEAEFAVAALDALSSLFACLKTAIPLSALQSLYDLLPKLLQLVLDNLKESKNGALAAEDAEDDEDEDQEAGYNDAADEEEVLYAWGRLQATLFETFPQLITQHSWAISFIHQRFTAGKGKSKAGKKASSASASSPAVNDAFAHAAMGVLCDWLVWCGPEGAVPFGQQLVDLITWGLGQHATPLVKQATVHLCGLMASRGGAAFRDFCLGVAPHLGKLIARPDSGAPSQAAITDNAVSSLIRIHRAFSLAASDSELIGGMLLPGLPVMQDEAEVPLVLEFLAGAWDPAATWAPELKSRLQRMQRMPGMAGNVNLSKILS